MDEASFCSAAAGTPIVGVRGGRVYKFDPTTGAVSSQADYSPLAFGRATCCYDPGINRIFATCFNIGHFDPTNFGSARNIYRINPNTNPPSVDLVIPFSTTFGVDIKYAAAECGIARMKAVSGNIYAYGWTGTIHPILTVFKFAAASPGTPVANSPQALVIIGSYPSFAYGSIAGEDVIMWADQDACDLESWNFSTGVQSNVGTDNTRNRVATEYAPVQGHLFVTAEFQFIYVYTLAGALVATVDTGRSNFNGVDIQRNPIDGFIYVAGGSDNSVAIINPATNLLVGAVLLGYDLPCGFVFSTTAKFAVQQGAVPLKAIP